MERIYLDHAATTPIDKDVLRRILEIQSEHFGNPSSVHSEGRRARALIDSARDQIANSIHSDYGEITFTSGGTEADNLAVLGAMQAAPNGKNRLIVSSIEHHAVLHAAHRATELGFNVTYLPVNAEGKVDPEDLRNCIDETVALVSVMHANNEIGTIQDISKMAKIAHGVGALFHTDAVQTFGILPIDVNGIGCDLMTLSSHKIYGPKGVGALFVRTGTKLNPQIRGGGQERERRGGTENIAGIVGFGLAAEIAYGLLETEPKRLTKLRDHFISQVLNRTKSVELNGAVTQRLPNNVNFSARLDDGSALVLALDRKGLAVSSGSACSSGSIEPSHVLTAIGRDAKMAASGVRFSLGRSTTVDHIDVAVDLYCDLLSRFEAQI